MWTLGILFLIDPHCGIGNKCNYRGINKWDVKRESCVRKELGLRDFIKITRGSCPKGDKPPCPP
ncbi:accessory gland protein Acp63F isoform X2 [Drosophila bipectinata]|uniref:accessory gland protein Acp63F isoform X2 n=1 Tax=Drosophila bipectinata TaxID=42026 RepID=UPI0007E69BCA|nr:accessory gland protein Acp63F-like isoform X2 [Drosophila bipectinata]